MANQYDQVAFDLLNLMAREGVAGAAGLGHFANDALTSVLTGGNYGNVPQNFQQAVDQYLTPKREFMAQNFNYTPGQDAQATEQRMAENMLGLFSRAPESVKRTAASAAQIAEQNPEALAALDMLSLMPGGGQAAAAGGGLFGLAKSINRANLTDIPNTPAGAKSKAKAASKVTSEIAGDNLPRRLRQVVDSGRYTLVDKEKRGSWSPVEIFKFRTKGAEHWPAVPNSMVDQKTGEEIQRAADQWYNPEIAELKPFRDKFGDRPKITLKDGWSNEIPAAQKDGVIYRGMSAEEYAEIQRTGEIKSLGEYNIGESQAGWTLYSTEPEQAASYANSFAPVQFKATPDRPAYVIAVKTPNDVMPGIPGQTFGGTSERAVGRALSSSDIVEVYEGVPYLDRGVKTEVIDDFGRIGDGSGLMYGSSVAWRKLK